MYIKKKKRKNWKFYFISQLKSTIVIAFNIYFLASSYQSLEPHPTPSVVIISEREESERERKIEKIFATN